MAKCDLYNMKGEIVGDIELSDAVFGIEVNTISMHTAVVNYLANQRQGTQSAKTKSEVSGGGKKPWRQKGTGRARHGSTRSAQWIKGGVVFAPKPRDYSYTINKKLKRLALKSALTSKVNGNNVLVLDELKLDEIKTKLMVGILNGLNIDSSALIVTAENNKTVVKSAGNIPGITTAFARSINVYDILKHEKLILTKEAVAKIEEVYV